MTKEKILALMRLVATTLQTDYPSKEEATKAMTALLEEVDKAAIEVSGKPVVKRMGQTLIENLANKSKNAIP